MSLKILVVDDVQVNRTILSRFFDKLGHKVIEAGNGQDAVDMFLSESPDIVIMDVMMPVMDGYEATKRIKSICGDKWVPVVFLTALNEMDHFLKGLDIGGDDFISKPFNFEILAAKIKVLERTIELQRELIEKSDILRMMNAKSEGELLLGKDVLDRLIGRERNQSGVTSWISPLNLFSGDIVLSAKSPDGTLHVLQADSAGHGLSAALAIVPAIELFYSMTTKGFGLGAITRELNRKIKRLMPLGYFMTATLLSVDYQDGIVTAWNGGNHPSLMIDGDGNILKAFESKHPPLGILSDQEFSAKIETGYLNEMQGDCRIYLYSDGIVDAEGDRGRFGQDKVIHTLCKSSPAARLENVRAALDNHIAGHPRVDDMSIVEIDCVADHLPVDPRKEEKGLNQDNARWHFDVTISAEHLKTLDLTPVIMNIVNSLGLDARYNSHLFLILSELVNNAIDHGLLALNSEEKHHPLGMERYFEKRAKHLMNIVQGEIEIGIANVIHEDRNCLRIAIRDTGVGFDLSRLKDIEQNEAKHGRGIPLVRSLCLSLDYLGSGNEAIAYYPLSEA